MLRPVHVSSELLADIVREGRHWRNVKCIVGVPSEAELTSVELLSQVEPPHVVLWFSLDSWDTSEPLIVQYEQAPVSHAQEAP